MKNPVTPKDAPSDEKADYNFGVIEKVVLEGKEIEFAIFASADAMPGSDGLDPTFTPPTA